MALIIEDGTGVTGATSYASVAEFTAYAAARGIVVPTTTPQIEALLLKGMDYIETLSSRLRGYPMKDTQLLSFPRYFYDSSYQTVLLGVPAAVKTAQIVAAITANSMELMPAVSASASQTTRQTVGPITVEYSAQRGSSSFSRIPHVDSLLGYLFATGSSQPTVVRG